MVRGRTASVLVRKWDGLSERRVPDELAVEEPLEVRLDGHLVTTTMRTPGHDFELAAGFCFTDGLLAGAPVTGVRYCATGSAVDTGYNVVTVETAGRAPVPAARLTTTTSSCGICGTAGLDQLRQRLSPLIDLATFDLDVLVKVGDQVRGAQTLFAATGGVHAASAFDRSGTPIVVREDVGRHNAVDKVVGRLLLDGELPAGGLGLFISGRASFEIVQKAWAAGFAAVLAVSAPSSLAVDTAREAGLLLAGFARDERLNIYAPAGHGGAATS
jgi:FdhD protein